MSALPLSDVTVVALEHAVAAPLATRHLADIGARVIKIERPDGGDFARHYDAQARGLSSFFVWCNRGKESVVLDLKAAPGRTALHALIARSDVYVQNLGPGATQRLGFGAASLRSEFPGLIVCDISGYGAEGPLRDRKAYDLLIQAEAGLVSVTGTTGEPCKAGISAADIAAAMYAFSGILAALIQRRRTGRGAHVEISMLESLAEWMGFPMYWSVGGQAPPPRTGAAHATIYPYGPFRCGDGATIMLAVQHDREWRAFAERVLQVPELATDPRFAISAARHENRATLRSRIESCFENKTRTQVTELLDEANIAFSQMRTPDELWSHEQLVARGRVTTVETAVGELPALRPPINIDGREVALGRVPGLGEHTAAVLAEIGFAEDSVL